MPKSKEDEINAENVVEENKLVKITKFLLSLLLILLVLAVIAMLLLSYIDPFRSQQFLLGDKNGNTNFSVSGSGTSQFYENMRFPDKRISYHISEECSLIKANQMKSAFKFLQIKTSLSFYEKFPNEEITINCVETSKPKGGLFIAGEGGPTNITATPIYNVIHSGEISLLRKSNCPKPNIGIHEIMHVLGFEHSPNPNNIMYNVSNCNQELGKDSIETINKLYSAETLPDLNILNVEGEINSLYLNFDIEIQNQGLAPSSPGKISVYGDGKLIKNFDIKGIEIGFGRVVKFENVLLKKNVKTVEFVIDIPNQELDKKNNRKELKIEG
jgi:hypothetical protein